MTEEILLRSPFSDKYKVLWHITFFAILLGVWLERNIMIYKYVECSCEEVWDRVRFNIFLRASITKSFCNYALGLILLVLSPFFFVVLGSVLWG